LWFAEQKRIIARVDELMTLVDRLEAQLAESQAKTEKLMEAVVGEIVATNG
jgi:type I restriction enzyme S subunit